MRFQAFLIFFLLSLLIVTVWFKDGFIYGGAEVGLFAYNPQRWFEISRYVWWESVFPGQVFPQFITGAPMYFFFYLLSNIGFPSQYIQALFLFLALFLMGFGAFILSWEIFDETKRKYSILAGLFYMFNTYTLVQVWHRFLFSTILLAAVLPFMVLFWRKWVRAGGITSLSVFLLISFLSVYMYGSLASIVTVWLILGLVSFGEVFFPWQGMLYAKKVSTRFLGGIIFWILLNVWWLAPTFSIAPAILSTQHTNEDNLGTLIVMGQYTVMPYLLQLANPFYLFYTKELGPIYSSFVFKAIPWIMSGFIFSGLIIGLRLKNYAKYCLIFIAALLLSKGASHPFPYPLIFGFENSFFLGVIRNPFEKLGIMLPMFGAILYVIGIEAFYKWGSKKFGVLPARLLVMVIITALIVYALPMFKGSIFGSKEYPVKVKVPDNYIQADNWLKEQRGEKGVILHLPYTGKDVVTYDWSEGYHGVDQNSILFTSLPSLSRVTGTKRVDDTLASLTNIFSFPVKEDQILRILQSLNIRFIILHKDTKLNDKDTYGEMEKVLDNLDFLERQKQFGQLVIYRLKDENYKSALTLTNNFQIVYPGNTDIMQILSKTVGMGEIITPVSGDIDEQIFKAGKQVLVFPDRKIEYQESSPSAMIARASDLHMRLLQVRNTLLSFGSLQSEKVISDLISADEKLFNLSSGLSLLDYEETMKKFINNFNEDLNFYKVYRDLAADILRIHLTVLDQIGGQENISRLIKNKMVELKLIPRYETYGQVFKFDVPKKANYDLISDFSSTKEIKINSNNIASNSAVLMDEEDYEISCYPHCSPLNQDLVLKLEGLGGVFSTGKILNFKKESSVLYTGKIRLEEPALISFAQTYHPGWSLTLVQGVKEYRTGKHFLGNLYGNAWLVEGEGDYDFRIEFTPQKYVEKGIIISVVTAAVIMVLNILFLKKLFKK